MERNATQRSSCQTNVPGDLAVDDAGEERGHADHFRSAILAAGLGSRGQAGTLGLVAVRVERPREHQPHRHAPERHHRRAAGSASRCSCGCCSSRGPAGRSRSPRPARHHRLRRRVHRPPLPPGQRPREGARPDRRPAAVHRRCRRHHGGWRRPAVVLRARPAAGDPGGRGDGGAHADGHEARRRVVVGEGRDDGFDDLVPRVPGQRGGLPVRRRHEGHRLGGRDTRARTQLLRRSHVPPGHATQPGRGAEPRGEQAGRPREGRHHGRGRGHPAPSAHLQHPQAAARPSPGAR